jgi:hypothetical protein
MRRVQDHKKLEGGGVAEGEQSAGRHTIVGLGATPPSVVVWKADVSREAPDWRLAGVDLGMRDGRPFGSLHFEEVNGSRRARVAVRWDHVYDQLQCFVTDRSFAAEGERLERDARHRVGTLMAAYAQIGLAIAAGTVAEGSLRAASNLVPIGPRHPG